MKKNVFQGFDNAKLKKMESIKGGQKTLKTNATTEHSSDEITVTEPGETHGGTTAAGHNRNDGVCYND